MDVLPFLVNGLVLGGIYAMAAIGFSIIFTTTRTFHFAHGAIYLFAGYAIHFVTEQLRWSLWAALLVAALLAVGLGVGIERLVYRPLRARRASPLALFVAALGLLIFLQNLIAVLFGSQAKPIVLPDLGPPLIAGDVVVTRVGLLQVLTALGLLGLALALLRWTTLGRALRAVASNQEMAAVIGVDVGRVYLQAFALGSLAIVPAALLNSATTGLDPSLGGFIMLMTMVSVIVGGVGSVAGAALGGLLIGGIQGLSGGYLPLAWQNGVVFGVLMVFIVLRPTGLLGAKLWQTGV
jgi:branched-chain amino acid transport system permease protein